MNGFQKNEILRLKKQGLGYKRISDILGLPVNTVKSYCYRNQIDSKELIHVCKQCGVKVNQNPKRKVKLFCSDACRMKWWNSHPDEIARRTTYEITCSFCGRKFDSYKKLRKFCSRGCYAKSRKKENCDG